MNVVIYFTLQKMYKRTEEIIGLKNTAILFFIVVE